MPGRNYNLLAFVAVIAGLLVALGLGAVFGVQIGHTLGIFAGSMTSTATLQAALDVIGNKDPSIGYSVAYPFGVIGPILCFYFLTRRVKPVFPPKPAQFHMGGGHDRTAARRAAAHSATSSGRCPTACRSRASARSTGISCPTPTCDCNNGDALLIVADERSRHRRDGRCIRSAGARQDRQGSRRSLLSAVLRLQGEPDGHAIGRSSDARRASRSRSCMSDAMTSISCRRRISCWRSATASA